MRRLIWLESRSLIKREGTRSGFAPGEAVALIAIASENARRRLRLPALARIVGIQSAIEERSADAEEGLLGEALTRAILGATAQVRRERQVITDLYGDINGERV